MTIRTTLRVKFRAFGITFANVEKEWTNIVPIPGAPDIPGQNLVMFDFRGIFLRVDILWTGTRFSHPEQPAAKGW